MWKEAKISRTVSKIHALLDARKEGKVGQTISGMSYPKSKKRKKWDNGQKKERGL